MGVCMVEGCRSRSDRESSISLFKIPKIIRRRCKEAELKSRRRQALWLARLNKPNLCDESIKDHMKVCNLHFIKGCPAPFATESDPDWAPSLRLGGNSNTSDHHEGEVKYSRLLRTQEATSNERVNDTNPVSEHSYAIGSGNGEYVKSEETDVDDDQSSMNINNSMLEINESVLDVSDNCVSSLNVRSYGDNATTVQKLEGIHKNLLELYKGYMRLRDQLTEAECDKLDLEKSVSDVNRSLQECLQEKEVADRENSVLKAQLQEARVSIANLQKELMDKETERINLVSALEEANACLFTLDELKRNDEKVKFYTGLPTYEVFNNVVTQVSDHVNYRTSAALAPWQGILLTMMRLRLNLTLQDLAYRFNIHVTTAGKTFEKWLYGMSIYLESLIHWPDRETSYDTMPNEFKKEFGKSVAVIIDCIEIFIGRPNALGTRATTWSNNKHRNNVKYLVGITPCGEISYISQAMGGSVSDEHLTVNSGLLDKLLPDDVVITHRGFLISEDLAAIRARRLMPALTKGKEQLASQDVFETSKIAHLRNHVGRVTGLVCNKYHILQSVLPVEFLNKKSGHEASEIDEIVKVSCALSNLCASVCYPDVDCYQGSAENILNN